MPETLTIEVTQEDIDKGKPKSMTCCPVALAFKRATGRKRGIYVLGMSVKVHGGGQMTSWWGGRAQGVFMWAFDRGEPVSPTTITFTR